MQSSIDRNCWYRARHGILLLGVLVTLAGGPVSPANAQQNPITRLRAEVGKMLKDGNITYQQTWSQYYTLMLETFVDKAAITAIHANRGQIKRELRIAGNAPSQTAHTRLNQLMLEQMQQIAGT